MNKRIQIPVSGPEEELFKLVAMKRGLSLAAWARQLMKEGAQAPPNHLPPEAALKALFAINAPVDQINIMIEQTFKGRYK